MYRPLSVLFAASLVTPPLSGQAPPPEEYAALTNPFSSAVNFNIETVRGMFLHSTGFYAINTHGSTVVHHTDLQPQPEGEWPTVQNPVAIAEWTGGVLVVGGGTWALVEHDWNTGYIKNHLELPAEPADIVVDTANGKAYVACQGANSVVRIDLASFTIDSVHPVSSQRPRFLSIDTVPTPAIVYVTPFLSGNNTTISDQPPLTPGTEGASDRRFTVVDLDATTAPGTDLPDEDLFRIITNQVNTPAVPVLRSGGTLMTAHGIHPITRKHWLLSTDLHNEAFQTEDKHRGKFADAQLAIATSIGASLPPSPLPKPDTTVDLDAVPLALKDVTTSASFPWSLAFHISSGQAAISSSTSDRIIWTDQNGIRITQLDLTPANHPFQGPMKSVVGRAIPRDVVIDNNLDLLYVYCWGWNVVLLYDLLDPSAPQLWFDLRHDPQPVAVQEGRSIFYDAQRAQDTEPGKLPFHGAVTCNTCHPGGGMDLLGWGLSDSQADVKDTMVTQSLLSISDTFPYHWRGERNLDHFNGAFKGLLGHKEVLTPDELEKFEAFVFSLQAPANPRQIIERKLSNMDARIGQNLFLTKDNVLFGQKCTDCHQMPGGTNGDRIREIFQGVPSATHHDVAHLRQLFHKDQPAWPVTVNNVATTRARGGFGIAHEGHSHDITTFVNPAVFAINAAEQADIVEFVRQFDQGIAPAAHRAYRIDAGNKGTMANTINMILLTQAGSGWVDVAAIGQDDVGGNAVPRRWAYDANTGMFSVHDNSVPARNWIAFQQAITGVAGYLVVGLPPGGARRFALDPDNDGLADWQETAAGSNPRDRDSDDDGADDGYEVQIGSNPSVVDPLIDPNPANITGFWMDHNAATFAKFYATFDEPVKWELYTLDANNNYAIASVTRSGAYVREATVHMHELYPSTLAAIGGVQRRYLPHLHVIDLAGNPMDIFGNEFTTAEAIVNTSPVIPKMLISKLDINGTPAHGGGSIGATVDVQIRAKAELTPGVSLGGRVVIARVLHRPKDVPTWTESKMPALSGTNVVSNFSLKNNNNPAYTFGALPGAFVLSSPTDGQGNAQFVFQRSGLTTGDEIRLAIVGIFIPAAGTNTFTRQSLEDWEHPLTQGGATPTVPGSKDRRGLTLVY